MISLSSLSPSIKAWCVCIVGALLYSTHGQCQSANVRSIAVSLAHGEVIAGATMLGDRLESRDEMEGEDEGEVESDSRWRGKMECECEVKGKGEVRTATEGSRVNNEVENEVESEMRVKVRVLVMVRVTGRVIVNCRVRVSLTRCSCRHCHSDGKGMWQMSEYAG